MIDKVIIYFGQPARVACDEQCDKAWGINKRPSEQLDPANEDDYAYLADGELGVAPDDPGTTEGCHAKPRTPEERGNKWCVRECERMAMSKNGAHESPVELPDFSVRRYNIPRLPCRFRLYPNIGWTAIPMALSGERRCNLRDGHHGHHTPESEKAT